MPQDESTQGRHLRVYTFLCQLIIAIITFYSAIAISHYDPTPASAVPRAVAPRTPFSDTNSTTPHICRTSVRDDLGTILIAITPYSVLCPSTPFFFLSLISFLFGIFKFNSLHTEDIDLFDSYSYFIIAGLVFLGRQNDSVSFQVIMPIYIWSATMLLPIGHWLFKTFSPGIYWRYRQAMRLQREAMWKAIKCREETVGDVEAGREVVEEGGVGGRINEETPLRRDEGRIG